MPKKRRYQRNHKLQKWMIDEVVAAMRDDRVSLGGAARRICVPQHTLYTWVMRGRSGSGTPLEAALAQAVDAVLYELESRWAQLVEYGSNKDWMRYLKLLERRFPNEWGALAAKQAAMEADEQVEIAE